MKSRDHATDCASRPTPSSPVGRCNCGADEENELLSLREIKSNALALVRLYRDSVWGAQQDGGFQGRFAIREWTELCDALGESREAISEEMTEECDRNTTAIEALFGRVASSKRAYDEFFDGDNSYRIVHETFVWRERPDFTNIESRRFIVAYDCEKALNILFVTFKTMAETNPGGTLYWRVKPKFTRRSPENGGLQLRCRASVLPLPWLPAMRRELDEADEPSGETTAENTMKTEERAA